MAKLEEILELLYRRISARQVLEGHVRAENIRKNDFVAVASPYLKKQNEPELENMWMYYQGLFREERREGNRPSLFEESGLEVFDTLFHYAGHMLVVHNNEILCRYERILDWKRVTTYLSEDVLICAYWAKTRTEGDMRKIGFSWPTVIGHNNVQITKIMERGISENHFHLKGSAPIFHISWVSLMNHILSSKIAGNLRKYDRDRRNVNARYDATYVEDGLEHQYRQAALIRLYLFTKIMDIEVQIGGIPNREQPEFENKEGGNSVLVDNRYAFGEQVFRMLSETENLRENLSDIQDLIDSLRNQAIGVGYLGGEILDYALQGAVDGFTEKNDIFSGERWFLYTCLKEIWMDTTDSRDKDLFYAYLLIKETIRAELIQSNNYVGFANFQKYERRKESLLEEPVFHEQMVKEAVRENLLRGNIESLELRITPQNTIEENYRRIHWYDSIIGEPRSKYFYTVHFIKEKDYADVTDIADSVLTGQEELRYRHYEKRANLRRQTDALVGLRERYPKCAARILGIDAAADEIGCRPEVFAVTFRRLRNHVKVLEDGCERKAIPQLRATYHVGEEFLDVTDGLRAIDEAVNFLNLDCGDRLGHALALGVDVDDWYKSKDYRIRIPQQDYLDNVAWLYHRLVDLAIPGMDELKDYLEKKFEYYFEVIYGRFINFADVDRILRDAGEYYRDMGISRDFQNDRCQFDIFQYYSAWKLRGDDPVLYERGFYEEKVLTTPEEKCMRNEIFPRENRIRFRPEAFLLYYFYHFDQKVKEAGRKRVEVRIRPMYVKGVKAVQIEMQRRLARRGIAVETNPTSNCMIGTFRDYAEHPILRWYNKGLDAAGEYAEDCPQLSVSINTDDMGVFATSLENEYALMANALENKTNSDGKSIYRKSDIYEWLDNIRQMGNDQSFRPKEETYRTILSVTG